MRLLHWVLTPFALISRHREGLGIYSPLQKRGKPKAALVILPSLC